MVLTFAEDFTTSIDLDSQLLGTPDSGLHWNRGVHPIVTVSNLLDMLPVLDFTFTAWDSGTTYGVFETSRKKSDIVSYDGSIYQSLQASNLNQQPDTATAYWLETNIESLRIKSFIWTVEDNFKAALTLNRRLIENQYIYNVGTELNTLPGNFAGWAFEPKGSDYVRIRINQMALQADTSGLVDLYVINQGTLLTTLQLTANNGILTFEDEEYEFIGKGRFLFVFDSQDVFSDNAYNDPLKYNSFVAYPVSGTGATAAGATYTETTNSNGLNFNVSTYLDSSGYITNNKIDFAKFLQTQFEFDFIKMALHNTNNRSNFDQRIVQSPVNEKLLSVESYNLDMQTVARKYNEEKKLAVQAVNRTFDKYLQKRKGLSVKKRVI